MGDIFFGRGKDTRVGEIPSPEFEYSAPDLREVYRIYQETGRVPYSYYGQGAPTREGELDLVRASYPSAFAEVPQQPEIPQQPTVSPFEQFLGGIFNMFNTLPNVNDEQAFGQDQPLLKLMQSLKRSGGR